MCEKLTSLSELGQRFTSENSQQEYKRLKDQKYDIVSRTAYLIGVREEAFGDENKLYHEDIYKQLDNNKNARIIRNLSILRTVFEIRYHKLFNEMRNNGRTILCMSEYIPQEILTQLSADGINLTQKSTYVPIDYILEINRTISERINNCKSRIFEFHSIIYKYSIYISIHIYFWINRSSPNNRSINNVLIINTHI